jgi:hypothetical protein
MKAEFLKMFWKNFHVEESSVYNPILADHALLQGYGLQDR